MDVEQNVVPIDDSQNIVLGKVEPIKTEPLETVPVLGKAQRLDIPVTSIAEFSQLQAGKILHLWKLVNGYISKSKSKSRFSSENESHLDFASSKEIVLYTSKNLKL